MHVLFPFSVFFLLFLESQQMLLTTAHIQLIKTASFPWDNKFVYDDNDEGCMLMDFNFVISLCSHTKKN